MVKDEVQARIKQLTLFIEMVKKATLQQGNFQKLCKATLLPKYLSKLPTRPVQTCSSLSQESVYSAGSNWQMTEEAQVAHIQTTLTTTCQVTCKQGWRACGVNSYMFH